MHTSKVPGSELRHSQGHMGGGRIRTGKLSATGSFSEPCFLFLLPDRFAYIEFADKESVRTAMALDESLFRGRQIKVGGRSPDGFASASSALGVVDCLTVT